MAEPLPAFVSRRRDRWQRLDELLKQMRRKALALDELEELDRLYRSTSSDLATAQSFYPESEAAVFLNQLCGRAYGFMYRRRLRPWQAIRDFYAREFPRLVWAERRLLRFAFLILTAGAVAGAVATLADPEVLGPLIPAPIRDAIDARSMWTDNILSAEPPLLLSSNLLTNNIGVALACFAGGITAGAITSTILFVNGLLLGGVITLCLERGLGFPFFSFVTAHGVVELSSLVIAGAAGFVLADALVNPGEAPRVEALRERGRHAVRIVLGTAPLFVAIGLIEGFVSPGNLYPGGLKIALGLAFGGVLWAYIIAVGRNASTEPSPTETNSAL
jgi:uncharacterized membrane protein SpoIIM required for sporulation